MQWFICAAAAPRPDVDRQPVSDHTVLTPEIPSQLQRKPFHEIAVKEGREEVAAARVELNGMTPEARLKWLQAHWREKLGNIDPNPYPKATIEWCKERPNTQAEAVSLEYVPQDVVLPGILERGDIADVEAALEPRPLLLAGMVNGLDQLVTQRELEQQLHPVSQAYRKTPSGVLSIQGGVNSPDLSDWFLKHWH
jgi:hypothetical protein